MKKYILKKILTIIPVMLIVSILTFGLVSIAPSDPAQIILGANGVKVTEEALELKREELGLNDPIHVQYLRWLKGVVTLDLGKSYTSGKPVINDFSKRTISSFKLALLGLIMLVAIAVPLGVFSAMYPNKILDKMIDETLQTVDETERQKDYDEIFKYMYEEAVDAPLYYTKDKYAYNKDRITGIENAATSYELI
ncbi:MAG: hypothetical protein ACI4PU_08015, partial [Intestinibacter sp.]